MKPTKLIAVILVLGLLCGCTRARQFGVWELEKRLCETDKKYAFDTESMFRKEGAYHVFYRTENGTLLLKVKEDEKQRITDISLTLASTDPDAAAAFSALACTLADVFLPEENRADAKAALKLADPATFFTDETLTAEYGRYQAIFFKTRKGASLMLVTEAGSSTFSTSERSKASLSIRLTVPGMVISVIEVRRKDLSLIFVRPLGRTTEVISPRQSHHGSFVPVHISP